MTELNVCELILPNEPLSNIQLEDAAKKLGIKNFRGVMRRDNLPISYHRGDCGIANLDDSYGEGTHWVAYYCDSSHNYYFDPYGIQPPLEIVRYLKSSIYYNSICVQPRGTVICGHLCLFVFKQLDNTGSLNCNKFNNILYKLI